MAVSNINDKSFVFAPITLNRDVNREQRTSNIENIERRITRIDSEIETRNHYRDALIASRDAHIESRNLIKENIAARERYIDSLVESKNLLKQNIESRKQFIANNEKLIAGGERLIKLHQEQKENINKRISLLESSKKLDRQKINTLQNTNAQLQDLLDGKKPIRSRSVQPVRNSKLEEVNTLPKGTLISEQKAKLESDVKKHNMAIDYHNTRLDKLVNSDKAKDITATTKLSKREGLVTGYKPTSPIPTLRTDNKPDTVKSPSSYVSNYLSQQQRYIAQSQVNIWDSIVTANIRKVV